MELYGDKAERKFGDIDGEVFCLWVRELSGFAVDDIAAGVIACEDRLDTWPPELQEFKRMCKENKKQPMHSEFKRLPILKAQITVANKERENLRKLGFRV